MLLVASFLHVASTHPMKPESEVAVRVLRNLSRANARLPLHPRYTVLRKQGWCMPKSQSCQAYLICQTSLGQWRHVVCDVACIAVAVVHRDLELEFKTGSFATTEIHLTSAFKANSLVPTCLRKDDCCLDYATDAAQDRLTMLFPDFVAFITPKPEPPPRRLRKPVARHESSADWVHGLRWLQ
jgi:hypothetical protein